MHARSPPPGAWRASCDQPVGRGGSSPRMSSSRSGSHRHRGLLCTNRTNFHDPDCMRCRAGRWHAAGGKGAVHGRRHVDGKPAMAEPETAKGRRSLTLAPGCWTPCRLTAPVRRPSGCPGAPATPTRVWWLPPRTAGYAPRDALGPVRPSGQARRAPVDPTPRPPALSRLDPVGRGAHPKVVSDMLGHATIALTLDTYSHLIPSLQQEAASVAAAAVLDPAATAPQPSPKGQVRTITSGS
jgi:hypothetical protein